MGPPVPQPQPAPQFNPPPSPPMTPYYTQPAAPAPQQHAGNAPQNPAAQPPAPAHTPAPAPPPGSQPGFVAPGPATHAPVEQPQMHPEPPTPAPPGSQPGFVAPGPATQQPAYAPPPSQPLAPSQSEQYGQSSQIIQPGAPVPQQPAPPPPQQMAPLGPPGTPLQPGQRVLEIPPTGLQSGSPFAYLSLTEVRGQNSFVLELVNLADESQLFRSDLQVNCPDPLLTVEMTVPLPPISPPQAGIYALQLLHNNEILGSLRIIVEDAAQ
jgi:hypothetical protein